MKTQIKIKAIAFTLLLIAASYISATAQSDEPVSPSENNPKALELIKQALRLESAMLYVRAIDKYKEVLKLEPKDFAAMGSIAGNYGNLGNAEEEVSWAQKAIDTSPRFWQGYISLGNGLGMQNKFEPAIKAFQKAAELAPKNPLPIYSLGVVAEGQHDFKKALDLYKKSIELDPKFENGLFSAAAMYANSKQFAEAKALLNKLLELNPKNEDARQMLAHIEREKPQ